jgi:EAL domain-containing protein (putative c-di-GMP-specific phosphodiesterase class I)/GGDEF domain-containing protein
MSEGIPPAPTVAGVLHDLARRGLIRAAAGSSEASGVPDAVPLAEVEARLAEVPFVSVCGLRNLAVLNHLYGPGLGDLAAEASRAVAEAVAREADPGARVARTRGPDMLVLHATPDRERARALAGRIRDTIAAVALPAGGGVVHLHPFVVVLETRSAGHGTTDELVRTLHEMRTLATRSDEDVVLLGGKEAVAVLDRLRSRDARLAWVTEALDQGHVEVHYQPVVNLQSGRIEDMEALARIATPSGLLTASEFIDDLHRLGETSTLDMHVMQRVAGSARALAGTSGRLFLNVSPLSLAAGAFRERLDSTLARLRAEGLQMVLVLELTEQALVEHHDVIRRIHRDHGVTFAVDDFGTGYSSLRTVSELAVSHVISFLKIDGSLVRPIVDSPENYKVVLGIAHLAKSLDLRVIAEHVETAQILERLRTTGIESGQGFFFDPPLPPEELLARHAGSGFSYVPSVSRPHLRILEPYLDRAFEAFYDRMLSDAHFSRFFQNEEQIRRLVDAQKRTFVESLDEDDTALGVRYALLGRRHAEMGIPLATFLKGADILHDQLLEVLVHATRETHVLRDTGRFFSGLREQMARGYVEWFLPEARGEIETLRRWARHALRIPGGVRDALFTFVAGVLDAAAAPLAATAEAKRPDPAGTKQHAATQAWLQDAGLEPGYRALLTDAESLEYFIGRHEHAAAYPILQRLIGRFHHFVLTLASAGPRARASGRGERTTSPRHRPSGAGRTRSGTGPTRSRPRSRRRRGPA